MWHTNIVVHKITYNLTDKLLSAEGYKKLGSASKTWSWYHDQLVVNLKLMYGGILPTSEQNTPGPWL